MTIMVITGVGLMWVYYSGVFASNQESSNSVIETPQSPTNEEITKALCKEIIRYPSHPYRLACKELGY